MRHVLAATLVLGLAACGGGGRSGPAVGFAATAAAPPLPLSNDVSTLAVGDLDGDGLADLVVADNATLPAELSWRRSLGDGTFGAAALVAVHAQCSDLLVTDLTADGWADLVLCDLGAKEVRVFVNLRDGTFAETATASFPDGPSGAAAGDLDGDGKRDVVVALYDAVVALRATDGLGAFDVVPLVTTAFGVYEPELADLDGDGLDDLVATTAGPNGTDPVLAVWVHDAPLAMASPATADLYVPYGAIRRARLDHDGLDDLVAIDGHHAFGLAAWDGAAFVSTPTTDEQDSSVTALAVADLDGDGWTDAVSSHREAGYVEVAHGGGGGELVRTTVLDVPSPLFVALGDVDGDGRADLVVFSNDDDTLRVFRGL